MPEIKKHTHNNQPAYAPQEERLNIISHALGTALALFGAFILIWKASMPLDGFKMASAVIYSVGMVLLFGMSTAYHSIRAGKVRRVFRIFDHSLIFLLILGTYAPICLVTLRGGWGYSIFSVVAAASVVGIVLNGVSVERFKRVSMACYIAAGWCVIVAFVPMFQRMEPGGICLLLAGGVAYTAGIPFYKKKSVRYFHAVWHGFVLTGAILHYLCVLWYIF